MDTEASTTVETVDKAESSFPLPTLSLPSTPTIDPGEGEAPTATTHGKANSKKRKGHRGGKKAAKKNGKCKNTSKGKEQRSGQGDNNKEETEKKGKDVSFNIGAAELQIAPSVTNSDTIDGKSEVEIKVLGEGQSSDLVMVDLKDNAHHAVDEESLGTQAHDDFPAETNAVVEGAIGDSETTTEAVADIDAGLEDVVHVLGSADTAGDIPGDTHADNIEDAHNGHEIDGQTMAGTDAAAIPDASNALADGNYSQDREKRKENVEGCESTLDQDIEEDLEDKEEVASDTEAEKSSPAPSISPGEGGEENSHLLIFPALDSSSASNATSPPFPALEQNDTSTSIESAVDLSISKTSTDETSSSPTSTDATSDSNSDSPASSSPQSSSSSSSLTSLSSSPTPTSPLFSLLPSHGKGLGLFAATSISKGTRLLSESPLLVVAHTMDSLSVVPAVASLTPSQREEFFSLSHPEHEERDMHLEIFLEMMMPMEEREGSGLSIQEELAARGIIFANSFMVFSEDGEQQKGIFPIASRINHSCLPNVYPSWSHRLQKLTVHAVRDLREGEELLTTYIPLCLPRAVRNTAELLGRYAFTCTCRSCDGRTEWSRRSEKRRGRMAVCDGMLEGRNVGVESAEEALMMARELVNLLDTEGIANMELVRCLHTAARLAHQSGQHEEAYELAKRALAVTEICTGADSPYFEKYERVMLEAKARVEAASVVEETRSRL